KRAQVWGQLGEHPGKDVKPFKTLPKEARFLSEEEEARLLAVCPPALQLLVRIGLLMGFRRQELALLRPMDVNLERGLITVPASYSNKNGESRSLPVGPRLKVLLQEILATRRDMATVLTTDAGIPWTPDGVTSAFRKASGRAGLGKIGPH